LLFYITLLLFVNDIALTLRKAIALLTERLDPVKAFSELEAPEIMRECVYMIEMLQDDAPTNRKWTGRDDNGAHHHGKIPLAEPVVTLTLSWRRNRTARPELVGRFRLDMEKLVAEGYATRDSGGYRLRFQRTENRMEVAINRGRAALPLAPVLVGY
jgi:hypothetical protein